MLAHQSERPLLEIESRFCMVAEQGMHRESELIRMNLPEKVEIDGDAFVLGAGFSKAVSNHMPLMSELSGLVLHRLSSVDKHLPTEIENSGTDIELWLSYLLDPAPYLLEPARLRYKALGLDIIDLIQYEIEEGERQAISEACPEWFRKLGEYWVENSSRIVTLNYDTLVERVVTDVGADSRPPLTSSQLYPGSMTPASRRTEYNFVAGPPVSNPPTLSKLHGSSNWYYSGEENYAGETLYQSGVRGWTFNERSEQRDYGYLGDKKPLIVAPMTDKSRLFQHETIRQTWKDAHTSMILAKRIFVLGYSLPQTDRTFQQLLHSASAASLTESPKLIYVVNSDPDLPASYSALLHHSYQIKDDYVGEGAAIRFVEELIADQTR